ncbi:hypothetical protein [Pacificimonas flava]|uniref:Uncharacterized protein n=1 Tax=Pacificimonas flava TaxID=1234595 RepID=M2TMW7_9SPHN|nr:hypothetical protein [Pacificimonas flava]EMD83086.1 hypothetical protein C725_1684 [Pacificimonas flava]MBB5280244.1 hypothetical protein [Pacificimonas flava]
MTDRKRSALKTIIVGAALSLGGVAAHAAQADMQFAPGSVTVTGVTVTLSGQAAQANPALDAAAAAFRAEKGMPAWQPGMERPHLMDYGTLPFRTMFPWMAMSLIAHRDLNDERDVTLAVDLDTLFVDGDRALGMSDQGRMAGTVTVLDAASDAEIGEFRVDTQGGHDGLAFTSMRSPRVREALTVKFAGQAVRRLQGESDREGAD